MESQKFSNAPITRKQIIKSIILFWVFMVIWVAGYFFKDFAPAVPNTTAQWMYGVYGLTSPNTSSLAFKLSIIFRLIGIIGTGISLGYYSYLVSNKRVGYMWVGLLALWAPVPTIIGYFLVWWKFKSF